MEVRIENIYTDTLDMMREQFCQREGFKRYFFAALYFIYVLIYVTLLKNEGSIIYCVFLILSGGYLIYTLFYPLICAKRYFKVIKQYNKGLVPQTIVQFTDENIVTECGTARFADPYDLVDKVIVLKHCIILQTGKTGRLMLSKDGFTKGSFEELKDLLRIKCPNLKNLV